MLIFNKTQLQQMEAGRINEFIKSLLIYLRNNYTESLLSVSDHELIAMIQLGIAKAKDYQIEADNEVIKYVTLMVQHGNDFDRRFWASDILKKSYFDVRETMEQLEEVPNRLLKTRRDLREDIAYLGHISQN